MNPEEILLITEAVEKLAHAVVMLSEAGANPAPVEEAILNLLERIKVAL